MIRPTKEQIVAAHKYFQTLAYPMLIGHIDEVIIYFKGYPIAPRSEFTGTLEFWRHYFVITGDCDYEQTR